VRGGTGSGLQHLKSARPAPETPAAGEVRGRIYDSILDTVGATPMVRLAKLAAAHGVVADLVGKCEFFNPLSSVKDRIGLAMIEALEAAGEIDRDTVVIEPTSGNTGIGLALVAAVKGYKLVLTMPDTMSEERRSLLMAYGADLILTPDSKGMHEAIRRAEALLEQHPDYFMPQQFSNPANPDAHRRTTARELLEQFERIDAFVAGVGTGGTITGVSEVLRAEMPGIRIYAVEPASSPILSGGEPGFHGIEGLGAGFVPDTLDLEAYDEVITVTDEDAGEHTRRLARDEGLLLGISSGANCHAALQVARELGPGKTVVTVFCDTGERYLTTDVFQAEGI
jgi:cysteine synthase A